ncbi:MAG: universal stress protein [Acidimicrobiia bacterium]
MPKTVIVPLDGSDFALRALPVAVSLADALDAELLLVTTPMTLDELDPSELPVWLSDAAAATGYDRVRTELLREHDALTAIAGCVDRADEPVLCMATHGRGALGTAVLGSVAQRAVRELGVPTALVGPNSDTEWRVDGPIVVCHDGSRASNAILPTAREWARTLNREVVIVHVVHPRDVETSSAPAAELEHAVEFFQTELADDGLRVLRDRHPAGGILELADDVAASLVALSTHGHTGRARLTLGGVAGAVIHAAPCPVLITRPRELAPSS